MNRGSATNDPRALEAKGASMRPRFMNRGSLGIERDHRASDSGFNEAPIHESGKCVGQSESRADLGCFNEAPIHESGKSGLMRPRSISNLRLQ